MNKLQVLLLITICLSASICYGQESVPGPSPVDIIYKAKNTTDPTNAQGAIERVEIIFDTRDINPANASILLVMHPFFLKEGSSARLTYGDQALQTWNGPGWIDDGDWKPMGIGTYNAAKDLTLQDGQGKIIQSVQIPFREISVMELFLANQKDADIIVHQFNLMDNTIASSRILAMEGISWWYIT